MKKILVMAALTSMAATPAMASKARLSSLGNAAQLIDTQTVFTNNADMMELGDYATLEFGNNNKPTYSATGVTSDPNHGEGGVTHTFSWGKLGVYLGHQDESAKTLVDAANSVGSSGAGTLLREQNPLDVFYGTEIAGLKWGFGVHYANSKTDTNSAKVHTAGISAGVRAANWDAAVRVGLDGKSEDTSGTLKSDGYYKVYGGYWLDTVYIYANYQNASAKVTMGANPEVKATETSYAVGANNVNKVDGGNFFYGVSYAASEAKYGSGKVNKSGLPVIAGMEIDATSWMTLRGSVSQTVFMQETKTDTGAATTKDNLLNDTTVGAGVGFKLNKFMVDASVAAASSSTGAIATDGNNFLTNASLTYMF